MNPQLSLGRRIKNLIIGKSRSAKDKSIFHKISLIAFFAWVGLGADGLSSSCYGPEQAFLALNGHIYLSVFVALGTVLTIFVISASYSQIIELFPHGGGGYLVASKLLSPSLGMVSGCALLVDYVLTISVSIASGADAIFSLFPLQWYRYSLCFAVFVLVVLILLNMRGIKESVLVLTPIFLIFLLTHAFIIVYAIFHNFSNLPGLAVSIKNDVHATSSGIGFVGLFLLVLRAYSMGAGTFTGIEAVSNGIPVLREPKVKTAKKTMNYMAFSLAFVVMGLMLAYLFYQVSPQSGKTLNAILFEKVTAHWGNAGYMFVFVTLTAEASILFVAAQAGFLDGPRVLANMAKDRWLPTQFSRLSDRLVTQNGVLLIGSMALAILIFTRGSVGLLIVLYSINVFITFCLSQLSMVRHWWLSRLENRQWYRKIIVNGIGLILCAFILVSMVFIKFHEGGWITLLLTGALVGLALMIKRHYYHTAKLLHRLNSLVNAAETKESFFPLRSLGQSIHVQKSDRYDKTAVLLVNGYNGIGLHTLFGVIRSFGGIFKNFVFVEIGVVDTGNFKGVQEVEHLEMQVKTNIGRYVQFMKDQGFYAEGISTIGVDIVDEVELLMPRILERFPGVIVFSGQLIFPKDSFILRLLHNNIVFALQRRLYQQGIPFVILPIRV